MPTTMYSYPTFWRAAWVLWFGAVTKSAIYSLFAWIEIFLSYNSLQHADGGLDIYWYRWDNVIGK